MQFMITTSNLEEINSLVNFIKTLGSDHNKPVEPEFKLFAPLNKRLEDKHLQGKYVGLARHLSPSNLVKLKKVRKEQGLEAALAWGSTFKGSIPKFSESKPKKSKHKRNGSKRWRKTCAWCESGFLALQSRTRVCSKRCRDAMYRQDKTQKLNQKVADASA